MMLRRLKEDVEKNLAPKEETIIEVGMKSHPADTVLYCMCECNTYFVPVVGNVFQSKLSIYFYFIICFIFIYINTSSQRIKSIKSHFFVKYICIYKNSYIIPYKTFEYRWIDLEI